MSVLSGLTQRHRMSLVHITHYNDEAASADRVINLVGQRWHRRQRRDGQHRAPRRPARCRGPPVGCAAAGTHAASATNTAAERRGRRPRCATSTSSSTRATGVLIHGLNGSGKSTLAWIMAGLLVPTAGELPARRQPGRRSGWRRGDLVPGGAAAADAQPRRPGNCLGRRFSTTTTTARWCAALATGRTRSRARAAPHRSAQRRPDAPRGAGRAARPHAAGADPRRAAGRPGRRQPARACCACSRTCAATPG